MLLNKSILISILSMIILTNCSTTRHLKSSEKFSLTNARVVLKNADTIKARTVWPQGDSLIIRNDTLGNISIPLMNVNKIMVHNRIKGAWQGAGLGFLAVWGAMPFLGAINATADPCEFECIGPKTTEQGFLFGLILGPVLGVIWGVPGGAIIGAIKGAEEAYILSE